MATERKKKTRSETARAKAKNAQRVAAKKKEESRENIHVTLTAIHAECVTLANHAHSIATMASNHLANMEEGEPKTLFEKSLTTFADNLSELVENLRLLKEAWSAGQFDCWNDELDPNTLMDGLQIHQNYSAWIEAYYATCGSMASYLSSGGQPHVNAGATGHTGD